ncbi:MAG: DUF4336 domain-containing protein [Cyanobacteria bacterium J06635_1]
MLRQVASNLWVAEQPFIYFGLSIGNRMTVIRLESGDLAVISPIRLSDDLQNQIDSLGRVRHIIAPNLFHYLFASDFKATYPQASFWAVPGLLEKRPELPIDRIIPGDSGCLLGEIDYAHFAGFNTLAPSGSANLGEYALFHRGSSTLILTDTAFHFDAQFPWAIRLAARVLGSYDQLGPSWLERLASRDKVLLRQSVKKILSWDFRRVIVAHGSMVNMDAKQRLIAGYDWFLEKIPSDHPLQ